MLDPNASNGEKIVKTQNAECKSQNTEWSKKAKRKTQLKRKMHKMQNTNAKNAKCKNAKCTKRKMHQEQAAYSKRSELSDETYKLRTLLSSEPAISLTL